MNIIEPHHKTLAVDILAALHPDGIFAKDVIVVSQIIADNDPDADEVEEETEEKEEEHVTFTGPKEYFGVMWLVTGFLVLLNLSSANSWYITGLQIVITCVLVWVRFQWTKSDPEPPKPEDER